MMDSVVVCDLCERRQDVTFAGGLRDGWPKCHGHTMRLESTTADIDAAVRAALGPVGPRALRELAREGGFRR